MIPLRKLKMERGRIMQMDNDENIEDQCERNRKERTSLIHSNRPVDQDMSPLIWKLIIAYVIIHILIFIGSMLFVSFKVASLREKVSLLEEKKNSSQLSDVKLDEENTSISAIPTGKTLLYAKDKSHSAPNFLPAHTTSVKLPIGPQRFDSHNLFDKDYGSRSTKPFIERHHIPPLKEYFKRYHHANAFNSQIREKEKVLSPPEIAFNEDDRRKI